MATVRTTWGGIGAALRAGDLRLAGEVAMAGLDVVWREGLAGMTTAWKTFARGLTDILDGAFPTIKSTQETAATGIAVYLTGLMAQLGIISNAEFKRRGDELLKMNGEAQDAISAAQREQRAKREAERKAEDAAGASAGNPDLDAARKRLADAVARARQAELDAQKPPAVNAPPLAAATVGVASRGAFGANLANQLGGGSTPWAQAAVQSAKSLASLDQKMDELIDVSGDRKAVVT